MIRLSIGSRIGRVLGSTSVASALTTTYPVKATKKTVFMKRVRVGMAERMAGFG
jgi:hypothetical protein